ncbi:hypothetical protein VNO77_00618 [Canavalia gladiata]|uniref:Uncharacterized protein n=1 Tax=Canavalia gladiata TaxID=3824 RepID=A0AAN9MPQ9_CANGL
MSCKALSHLVGDTSERTMVGHGNFVYVPVIVLAYTILPRVRAFVLKRFKQMRLERREKERELELRVSL